MFLGAYSWSFTNAIFNKDKTYSLTPPDETPENIQWYPHYITDIPNTGSVFIYNTKDGKRYEINKLALDKYYGFGVDTSGAAIQNITTDTTSVIYYPIVEIPAITNAGYSLSTLKKTLEDAGFTVTTIAGNPLTNSKTDQITIPYTTSAELAIIMQAENDYNALLNTISSSSTASIANSSSINVLAKDMPPNPPSFPLSSAGIVVSSNPSNTTNTSNILQTFMDMKIAGVSAPLVVGGALVLVFLLRR